MSRHQVFRLPPASSRLRSLRGHGGLTPALVSVLLATIAANLAGCGASLNGEIESGLAPSGQLTAAGGSATQTGGAASPVQLAQAADTLTAVATPGNASYKIGPQDLLDISVFKVPELSRSVQVADTGTVNLPLVGEVAAAGKTARELEHDLATKLGAKYLQSPQVTVSVKEYNSQRITVDGAVKKPGVYPMRGKTTLLQSIASADGLNDLSDTSNIVVFRSDGNKRSAARFDLAEIRAGRADDPALRPGDVVIVNESTGKAAFQSVLKALPITSLFMLL